MNYELPILNFQLKKDIPSGVILWEGKGFNGEPVACVLTGLAEDSENPKTGPGLQSWIIRTDIHPHEAVKSGKDSAVCADCSLRPSLRKSPKDKGCYVVFGPAPVYHKYVSGGYPHYNPRLHNELIAGRFLRIGSYGEPVLVPYRIWDRLVQIVDNHTGYTHQWKKVSRKWSNILMASCDNQELQKQAEAMGWRTFTTGPKQPGQVQCPAAEESGKLTTCNKCGLCSGNQVAYARNVTIPVHGVRSGKPRKKRKVAA